MNFATFPLGFLIEKHIHLIHFFFLNRLLLHFLELIYGLARVLLVNMVLI